jgi:exopolysaccharide production protein ExoY
MTSERIHPNTLLAVEDSECTREVTAVQERKLATSRPGAWHREDLSAISMSANLLALNGVLAGGRLAALPGIQLPKAARERSAHASICLGKRVFDVVFAICALLTFLPVLLACAIAMRVESSGPLLFRQRRLGTNGVPFHIVKFRTMVPNAESVLASYLALDPKAKAEWEADRKLKNDPRMTRAGAIMRKFSLDEVPQFWNVLRGEMSIVGPRPIVQAEVQYYGDDFSSYAAVRPGITGLWQVSGRNDVSYPNRVALDCRYVASWSFGMDLGIILRTVSAVLRSAGAY